MKKFIQGPLSENARNFMRRAGYGELQNRRGQMSYSRRLGGGQYPRFHAYVEDSNGGIQINLHVDQKQSSQGSGAAHGGEYDGPLVENELARIVGLATVQTGGPTEEKRYRDDYPPKKEKGKGLFGKLFG